MSNVRYGAHAGIEYSLKQGESELQERKEDPTVKPNENINIDKIENITERETGFRKRKRKNG